jgi:hypothetical protein
MEQTMTISDGAELIGAARDEGILGDGLEAFCALEELLADAPAWLPTSGAAWEQAATRRPDLVEQITERSIEQGTEPAELALEFLVAADAGGEAQPEAAEPVLVACELAAATAFAETA